MKDGAVMSSRRTRTSLRVRRTVGGKSATLHRRSGMLFVYAVLTMALTAP